MSSTFWKEPIKIKNLSIPKFMSAPMDGITDSPARQMIRKFSTDELLFGEMRHVASVVNEKTELALKYNPVEQPLAFQASANTTNFIEQAVEKIVNSKFAMINFNACCPAKNVIKSGAGSALMSKPKLLKEILLLFKKSIPDSIPFSIKIRAGFKEKNGIEIAQLAEDSGAELLIIHPRRQVDGFSGNLDFEMVMEIKKKISIPVVFSGEIKNFSDIKKTYEMTGADGFMIGRALWGTPWKLKEIYMASEETTFSEEKIFFISQAEIVKLALEHLDLSMNTYGTNGFLPFKIHLARYIKGLPNAAALRQELLTMESYNELKSKLLFLQNMYKN